ncbi:hypothetical protein Ahy_A06g027019 [Arachis hypogaea]|uniref:Ubiquitin-like protease family profile domain-containing protein n=1 Tax=Arachis hypogaea TaxID=3818 RepID=A0A445CMD3_ARAHY|nr:hypothetical protein Ahy_A06g027019 [Arachis hypogaea]
MRAYAGGEPLKKDEKEKEIKASYVNISGQKSTYDCAIYVMKWLELIEPENIKKGNDEWDNWKQDEVDHYRVEYALRILFSEMNKERDQAIRASNAIRLSKPSSVLLSPFCQINSTDIETDIFKGGKGHSNLRNKLVINNRERLQNTPCQKL